MFHTKTIVRKHATFLALAVAVAGAGALSSVGNAATINWTGGNAATDLNWSDALNWNPSTAAPVNDYYTDIAHFGLASYTGLQPNLDANRSVHGILIDGAGTLAFTGTGATYLGSGGLTMSAGAGPVSFAGTGGLRVDEVQTWTNASASNLTLTTITRAGGGRTLSVINTGGGQIQTTSVNDATGLLNGPWMSYTDATGTHYATVSGGAVAAYTSGIALTDVSAIGTTTAGTENDDIAGGTLTNNIMTASAVANTVRYSGAAQTIQLGDATHSNVTLQANGIMSAGTGKLTISDGTPDHSGAVMVNGETVLTAGGADLELTASLVSNSASGRSISVAGSNHVLLNSVINKGAGTLTFNGFGGVYYVGSSGKLILNAASGAINWATNTGGNGFDNPVIADNPTTAGSVVEISGTNPVNLSGNNTYTGGTILDAGASLVLGARYYGTGTANLGTGPVTINAGATISSAQDNQAMWISGAPNQIWNGSWTMANAGVSFATTAAGAGPYGSVLLNAPNIVFTQNGNKGVNEGSVGDGGNNYGFTVINTVAGASTLYLAGTNSFTGLLSIGDGTHTGAVGLTGTSTGWQGNVLVTNTGTLVVGSNGLGLSTINFQSGATLTDGGSIGVSQAANLYMGGTLNTYSYNGTLNLSAALVTLTSPLTISFYQTSANRSQAFEIDHLSDAGHSYGLTVQLAAPTDAGSVNLGGFVTITGPITVLNGTSLQFLGGSAVHRDVTLNVDTAASFYSDYTVTSTILAGINDGPTGGGFIGAGSNGLTLKLTGSGSYHYSGVINGARNAIMMASTGTQSLSGANSYTSSTSLYSGTLNLDFSGPSTAGSLSDNIDPTHAGYLSDILYHNATPPGISAGIVNPGITLSGGTLQLTGKSGTSDLQRVSNFGVFSGQSNIRLNNNGATSLILSTGDFLTNHYGYPAGTLLNFDLSQAGTQSATNGVLTTARNVNGILATSDSYNGATGAKVPLAVAVVTSGGVDANGNAKVDWAVSGATEVPAGVAVGTDPGTWYETGDGSVYFLGSLPNGTPVSFNTISAGSGINQGQLYYVVGSSGGAFPQFKVVATRGGTSPPTGATIGSSGTNTIDTQGNISALGTYATFHGDGTSDLATDNSLILDNATMNASTNIYTLKITTSQPGQSLTLATGNLSTVGGGILFTGANDYTIAGPGGLSSNAASFQFAQFGTGNLTVAANIGYVYGAGLTKSGPGKLTLTGANTFSGFVYLNQGVLNFNSFSYDGVTASALGAGGPTRSQNTGYITFNGGTLQYAANYLANTTVAGDTGDITNRSVTINPGGATVDTNGNDIVWTKAFGGGDAGGLIGGVPTGGFTKTGAGKLTLQGQGNYAGATTVSGGTLSVATLANSGVASSIGISTYASSNLVLDGGTLQYTGLATSTDRNFTVTANGGAIDASGASNAALAFTNTSPINFSGSGAHTLTLTGSSSGANTMGLLIADATAASSPTSLAKTGAGTWVLPSANTYTGGTSISNGLLLVSNTTGSATGTGDIHMTGGTLGGAGKLSGNVIGGVGAHTIAPSAGLVGNTATNLTLGGLTTSSDTTLAFNLATPGALNVNDKITVTSANGLTLTGGHVAITHTTTGVPSLGYYKAIAYNGTLGGTLGSITMPTVVNNVSYVLDSAHDAGFIDIHRGFLGDANDDGTVNFSDFLILSQNYGQPGGWTRANFLSDATVDFSDFLVLSQHFGQSIGVSDSVATPAELAQFQAASASFFAGTGVPEPTSLALLGIGAAALLTRRRRQA